MFLRDNGKATKTMSNNGSTPPNQLYLSTFNTHNGSLVLLRHLHLREVLFTHINSRTGMKVPLLSLRRKDTELPAKFLALEPCGCTVA